MHRSVRFPFLLLVTALIGGLSLAACSDDDGDSPDEGDSGPGPTMDSGATPAPDDSGTPTPTPDAMTPSPTALSEADCLAAAEAMGTTIGDAEQATCTEGVTSAVCEEAASCYCTNCICLLGACEMNPNCVGLRECAVATGCSDMACFIANILDPACSGLATWGADMAAVATLTGLGECLMTNSCSDISCDAGDGGTDDGG